MQVSDISIRDGLERVIEIDYKLSDASFSVIFELIDKIRNGLDASLAINISEKRAAAAMICPVSR